MASKGKTIVLGITGSISAYKAADLAARFTKDGFRVDAVFTESAMKFATPMTMRNLTGRPVVTSMWELSSEFSVEHVALSEAADVILVAPASANIIARLANGIADDMLTCTVLATRVPVIVAPAMNDNMWANQVTQDNVAKLKKRGFIFVGPAYGRLASGKMGLGRLADLDEIYGVTLQVLGKKGDLAGKHIVVTAGGTQEPVDPVRCLTNRSSGKMGYAIAEAARNRGAAVTLISGPTSLFKPAGVKFVDVNTAEEMLKAVLDATKKANALIMAAAVADFRPATASGSKIKRADLNNLMLKLEKTPDILEQARGNFIRVGFAAESDNVISNAAEKVKLKGLDLIVANNITEKGSGFGTDTNRVVIVDSKGKAEELPLMTKYEVADKILDRVAGLLKKK